MNEKVLKLHEKAIEAANLNKKSEADLISILQEIGKERAYLYFQVTSLYDYCVSVLKLSEGTSYNLISVARKSLEVPALKDAIVKGEITVSKAKKIASVITKSNQDEWLKLASKKTSREIEKAVARVNPEIIQESVRYKTEDRLEMKLGISEKLLKKLERVMDLESQRTKKASTREGALEVAIDLYLEKNDPLKKAERHFAKRDAKVISETIANSALTSTSASTPRDAKQFPGTVDQSKSVRKPLSARLQYTIALRDQLRCMHVNENGSRCANTRWLDTHHIVPVAQGGTNTPENLITLCSSHHKMVHTVHQKPIRSGACL